MLIPEASHKFVQTSTGAYMSFYSEETGDTTVSGKPKKRQVFHNECGPAYYDPKITKEPDYYLVGVRLTLEQWAEKLHKTDEEVLWQKLHFR